MICGYRVSKQEERSGIFHIGRNGQDQRVARLVIVDTADLIVHIGTAISNHLAVVDTGASSIHIRSTILIRLAVASSIHIQSATSSSAQ